MPAHVQQVQLLSVSQPHCQSPGVTQQSTSPTPQQSAEAAAVVQHALQLTAMQVKYGCAVSQKQTMGGNGGLRPRMIKFQWLSLKPTVTARDCSVGRSLHNSPIHSWTKWHAIASQTYHSW